MAQRGSGGAMGSDALAAEADLSLRASEALRLFAAEAASPTRALAAAATLIESLDQITLHCEEEDTPGVDPFARPSPALAPRADPFDLVSLNAHLLILSSPGCRLGTLVATQEDLATVVHTMLALRYDSASGLPPGLPHSLGGEAPRPPSPGPKSAARVRIDLVGSLDTLIRWLRHQPFDADLLAAFSAVLDRATEKALLRSRTLSLAMEWLARPANKGCFTADIWPAVEDFMVRGLTDVWSAIRKTCAAALFDVAGLLTLQQVEPLFRRLIRICHTGGTAWKAADGALLGVASLLRRFNWTSKVDGGNGTSSAAPSSAMDSLGDRDAFCLIFNGRRLADGLPEFVTNDVREVTYKLLAHKQLSIRENATKAFSAYLSRSQFREALSALHEIVSRLRRHVPGETAGPGGLPAAAPEAEPARRDPPKLLDPYEAEGLLGVCMFIVKHIPPGFLLPRWPLYFSTLDLYLMHGASTVRQAASTVFKYIVAKDSSNPIMLKLVLQGLAASWVVSGGQAATTAPGASEPDGGKRQPMASIQGPSSGPVWDTWEWREGRMLAYELIFKFLITNHVHYLFPTAMLGAPYRTKEGPGITVAQRKIRRRLSVPDVKLLASHRRSNSGSWNAHFLNKSSDDPWRHSSDSRAASPLSSSGGRKASHSATSTPVADRAHIGSRSYAAVSASATPSGSMPLLRFPRATPTSAQDPPPAKPGQELEPLPSVFSSRRASMTSEDDLVGGVEMRRSMSKQGSAGSLQKRASTGSLSRNSSTSSLPPSLDEMPARAAAATGVAQQEAAAEGQGPTLNSQKRLYRKSSRRTRMIDQHLANVDGVRPSQPFRKKKPVSKMTLVREYSAGVSNHSSSLSLISHVQALDLHAVGDEFAEVAEEAALAGQAVGQPAVAFGRTLGSRLLLPMEERHLRITGATQNTWNDDTPGAGHIPGWVDTSRFQPMSSVLWHILLQTAESMGSARFELRRIGSMVLPLLAEVMRWYDWDTLTQFWQAALPLNNTWLCYVACLALQKSLLHAVWLMAFFKKPTAHSSRNAKCYEETERVIRSAKECLPDLLPDLGRMAAATSFNKLTVAAMHTVVLLVTDLRDAVASDAPALERLVCSRIAFVFLKAHPCHRDLELVAERLPVDLEQPLVAASEGLLSCLSRPWPESDAGKATVVLSAIIDALHPHLPAFVDACDMQLSLDVFPVLLHFVVAGRTIDEDVAKFCLEAVHRIVDRAGHCHWATQSPVEGDLRPKSPSTERPPPELKARLDTMSRRVVEGILEAFLMDGRDSTTLRRYLEVLLTLCVVESDTTHLRAYFLALAARATQAGAALPTAQAKPSAEVARTMSMLSIGAGETMVHAGDSTSEDEGEGEGAAEAGAGLNLSGQLSNLSLYDGSEWDTSDDGLHSDEAVLQLIAEYLHAFARVFEAPLVLGRIQARVEARPADTRPITVQQVLDGLPDKDQQTLSWVMDQYPGIASR